MARLAAPARVRKVLLASLLVAFAALLVIAPVFVLAMAPAIALFAMVANRIRPGEARFARMLARYRARRPRPVRSSAGYHVIVVRRTGRSLASALAMRPPPAPLPALS